ncbi:MAG: tetratricopeptide repeat protein [Thermoanaerobaculia bacterium]
MMQRTLFATALVATLGLSACSDAPDGSERAAKIPVTTDSKRALEYFEQGRELADKIRFTDARDYFLRAIDEDPQFALAYLYLANNAVSAKEFFSSLKKAVFLADEVSEGERHWILAQDAGNRGLPDAQLEHLQALIDLYPEDERGHSLLGGYYFGRQEWELAIAQFQRATAINQDFSQAYNMLGYANRARGDYDGAEQAFQKYIELIPDEPNPYDSYAELLMKVGRFDESIENYRKALAKNPQFVFSYVGIGNNQMFAGDFESARATFSDLTENARNNGERRTAHFWTSVSHIFEDNAEAAVASAREMSAIAASDDDVAAMAGDTTFIGNIYLFSGALTEALAEYRRGVELAQVADVNDDVKETARRNLAYHEARVALFDGDQATAAARAAEFRKAAMEKGIASEIRRSHEIAGLLSLHQGDPETALRELEQANAQDPVVVYLMAKAAFELGDVERARSLAEKAAHFNQLTPNFALVKARADRLVALVDGEDA